MKKVHASAILSFIFCLFIACSSDDTTAIDIPENQAISLSELKNGIEIDGSTIETGTPPAPNGSLNFQISTQKQDAFQGTGYTISFSSSDNVAGAYIQLKNVNGNNADDYFDVPSSSFQTDTKSTHKKKKSSLNSIAKASNVGAYEIDVDFNNTIQPGEFCYVICLYDETGNISQIQEICVQIDAWGGNEEIIGEWLFDRFEPAQDDENIYTLNCANDQTLEVPFSQYTTDDWTLALNADGSYYEIYDEVSKQLDIDASEGECLAIYADQLIENKEKFSGFWAFNQDKQTLAIVDFKFENLLDSSENEDYNEGELYFEGVTAEVINDELVLSEIDTEDGQTINKAIFKRN